MNVSAHLAQGIVDEMKEIINQDINYVNNNAIIIASTDKNRIGDFHSGSKKVLESKRELFISHDGEYKGAKEGINIPIYFEEQVIGVIGITGERKEVEVYGRVIKRMTEILIKEGYVREQKMLEKESKRQFAEELLFRYHSDNSVLFSRAELLSIKPNANRIVTVARIIERDSEFMLTPDTNDKILDSFKSQIEYNTQNLIVQSGMNIIIIYELRAKENIETLISQIKGHIEKKYMVDVYFGIGNLYKDIKEIKKSYKEAKRALDISVALGNKGIVRYKDLDIGLLIDDISIETINKYVDKIFRNMDEDEVNQYSQLMDAYINDNGSITKASEKLFIHKNTLQYRLNKLKRLTGFDPRDLKDMVVLYLAFILKRLDFGE